MTKNKQLIIILFFLIITLAFITLAIVIAFGIYHLLTPNQVSIKPCTKEARLCPDGSAVGRIPPNCEFAECPSPKIIGGEKDEYGCLIAAGYSWCEQKQKCLRIWEESCADTDNWQTYQNEEYGYEVKYPKDWTYAECDKVQVGFTPPDGSQLHCGTESYTNIEISVFKKEDNINQYIQFTEDYLDNLSKTDIKINNIDAVKISGSIKKLEPPVLAPGTERIQIYFSYSNIFYFFDYYGWNNQNYSNIFDQILSTFKFIEKVDTSNWQTYRNEKYGFEFKCPSDWSLLIERETGFFIFQEKKGLVKKISVGTMEVDKILKDVTETISRYRETLSKNENFAERLITVGGVSATEMNFKRKEDDSRWVFLSHIFVLEGKDIRIIFIRDISPKEEYPSVYDQILSTFKFIE